MSDVEKMIALIDRHAALDSEIAALEKQVERLHNARQDRLGTAHEIDGLLQRMDVRSEGNYGWSARTARLLYAVIKQTRAAAASGGSDGA